MYVDFLGTGLDKKLDIPLGRCSSNLRGNFKFVLPTGVDFLGIFLDATLDIRSRGASSSNLRGNFKFVLPTGVDFIGIFLDATLDIRSSGGSSSNLRGDFKFDFNTGVEFLGISLDVKPDICSRGCPCSNFKFVLPTGVDFWAYSLMRLWTFVQVAVLPQIYGAILNLLPAGVDFLGIFLDVMLDIRSRGCCLAQITGQF